MCKFGKHEICTNCGRCSLILDTIEIFVAFAGVLCIGIGLQLLSTVTVVVGNIPFVWLEGLLMLVVGLAVLLLSATLVLPLPQRLFVLVTGLLITLSGSLNIWLHPRKSVVCPCPANYFGSRDGVLLDACEPCDCGTGICRDTLYGDGSCACPARYDNDCQTCVLGASGPNCEFARVGWNYVGHTASTSALTCLPGYLPHNGDCEFSATGVITHQCDVGWKTECVRRTDITTRYPWIGPDADYSDCADDLVYERVVICDTCAEGFNGPKCTPCNKCGTGANVDPLATCQTNLDRQLTASLTEIVCASDFDCDSFECFFESGQMGLCTTAARAKTDCDCNSVGYAGPMCTACPGATEGHLGGPCVGGQCVYDLITQQSKCSCPNGFTGERCALKERTQECISGYYGHSGSKHGIDCQPVTCQNGRADDGFNGVGTCRFCYQSEWVFSGIGMWDLGPDNNCDVCAAGIDLVGCGEKCLPTPEYQWQTNCGEVLRCERNEGNPCADDCVDSVKGYICSTCAPEEILILPDDTC